MIDKTEMQFARAIYSIAKEKDKVDVFCKNFEDVSSALHDNEELMLFLSSPSIDLNTKDEVFKNIFSFLEKDIYVFFHIVIKKHQIRRISSIVDAYYQLMNYDRNILKGIIHTAFELNDETKKRIEEKFSKRYGKRVIFDVVIDRRLIAGMKILLEDRLIDFSVDSKIEAIKENLSFKRSL